MTHTINGTKTAAVNVGDTVTCIRTHPYAVIGDVHVVTKDTEAFYSLHVGNGFFQIKPKPMLKSKLYIPDQPDNPLAIRQTTSTFPLGESYVKVHGFGEIADAVDIHYRYTGDASLFLLANFVNALRLKGVTELNLYCPYFPGCRSDRVNEDNQGEALSSKVYADFINAMKFDKVVILDPHSDVTVVVLNNVNAFSNVSFVRSILDGFNQEFLFITPDAGANKKVDSMAKKTAPGRKIIRADKKRVDGTLVPGECVVYATEEEIKDKVCVIVDDICSRGGTFKVLAAELKRLGAKQVICIFSHYENTADQESLKAAGIDKIFTTNSLIDVAEGTDFIHITNIEPFLAK